MKSYNTPKKSGSADKGDTGGLKFITATIALRRKHPDLVVRRMVRAHVYYNDSSNCYVIKTVHGSFLDYIPVSAVTITQERWTDILNKYPDETDQADALLGLLGWFN